MHTNRAHRLFIGVICLVNYDKFVMGGGKIGYSNCLHSDRKQKLLKQGPHYHVFHIQGDVHV